MSTLAAANIHKIRTKVLSKLIPLFRIRPRISDINFPAALVPKSRSRRACITALCAIIHKIQQFKVRGEFAVSL